MIRDDQNYAAHVDYCHINPLKHGYVKRVVDWPYWSFRRCVERGIYPLDWCGGLECGWEAGERA